MISTCKNNQDVCENHFSNVRQNCLSYGSPTETEAMASMGKSIFIRMENVQKSKCEIMKEKYYNTAQKMNRKCNSSVGGTIPWNKQRAEQGKVLKSA